MERLYRIETDVLLDDRLRHKVIQAAREDYEKSEGYWTAEDGERVRITAEEFVVDTKTAFLEIAESGFRAVVPEIEPRAFRCGIEGGAEVRPILRVARNCRPRRVPR
jgi:hypothetical protein